MYMYMNTHVHVHVYCSTHSKGVHMCTCTPVHVHVCMCAFKTALSRQPLEGVWGVPCPLDTIHVQYMRSGGVRINCIPLSGIVQWWWWLWYGWQVHCHSPLPLRGRQAHTSCKQTTRAGARVTSEYHALCKSVHTSCSHTRQPITP